MNFRKTSKWPLTAPPPHPIFGNYIALFATEFFGVERPPSFPLPKKRKEIVWIGKDPPPGLRKFSENSSNLLDQVIPYQAFLNM